METKRLALFIVVIFLGIGSQGAFAQESDSYTRAIGGRFGVANGITYKHFLNESHAIDGIVNFQGNRSFAIFKLLVLYELPQPLKIGIESFMKRGFKYVCLYV